MNKATLSIAHSRIGHHIVLDGEVRSEVLALIGDVLNYPAPGTALSPIVPLPAAGSKPLIALCLGHGRSGDEGVESVDSTSEEDYNHPLIERVASELRRLGHDVCVLSYYEGNGYTAAMSWVAKTLVAKQATAAVEFHFNASAGTARGHEFLHWNESTGGVKLAKALLCAFDQAFPEHPSRGLKPKAATDRGALFLSLTHCPACIAEPFFGDNAEEWHLFSTDEGVERLVAAYVAGITAWLESEDAS